MAEQLPPAEVEALMERAEALWRARGSRMTEVRRTICRHLFASDEAVDADVLLARARETDGLISLSTVYRTLRGLAESELVESFDDGEGKCSYRPARSHDPGTSHIVCRDCGRVFPLENPCLTLREGALARERGFTPRKISLRFEATCDTYREHGRCEG